LGWLVAEGAQFCYPAEFAQRFTGLRPPVAVDRARIATYAFQLGLQGARKRYAIIREIFGISRLVSSRR
jgi:hypothetical protein